MRQQKIHEDWSAPTTHIQRFGDAMERLCNGVRPSDELLNSWLDPRNEGADLQEFAIEHGPVWAQGIVVIDAALVLAASPTEGVDHEMLEHDVDADALDASTAVAPSSDQQLEIERLHRQLAEKTLDATRAWLRYESANRMCMSLQIERAELARRGESPSPERVSPPAATHERSVLNCWCETCDLAQGHLLGRTRMSVCPNCGDKRCPRAIHHDAACAAATPSPASSEIQHG